MKLNRLSQMLIHSHLDASFFVQNKGIPRFKKIDDEERKHKIYQLKSDYVAMEKKCKPLDTLYPLIEKFIGKRKIS